MLVSFDMETAALKKLPWLLLMGKGRWGERQQHRLVLPFPEEVKEEMKEVEGREVKKGR